MPKLPLFSALFFASLLFTAKAQADVVDDVPRECFPGTHSDFCHGGAYCSALTCTTDADCSGGHCEARPFCVGSITCGGRLPAELRDNPPKTETVVSVCEKNECPMGGECKTLNVCMPGPATADTPRPVNTFASPPPPSDNTPAAGPHAGSGARGCGCEMGSPSLAWAGVLVGAGCLVLGMRRRR